MTPPDPSGSTTARHEYPNLDEAEVNDFNNDFMKMVEAFK